MPAVSEAEALQMICPMVRNDVGRCMGTGCMAWQWNEAPDQYERAYGTVTPAGDAWEWVAATERVSSHWKRPRERRGVCGVAVHGGFIDNA